MICARMATTAGSAALPQRRLPWANLPPSIQMVIFATLSAPLSASCSWVEFFRLSDLSTGAYIACFKNKLSSRTPLHTQGVGEIHMEGAAGAIAFILVVGIYSGIVTPRSPAFWHLPMRLRLLRSTRCYPQRFGQGDQDYGGSGQRRDGDAQACMR